MMEYENSDHEEVAHGHGVKESNPDWGTSLPFAFWYRQF